MKLADELSQIEKEKALQNWDTTIEQLAEFLRERARGDFCAAVLIGVHTHQTERLLEEWARENGFDIAVSGSMFVKTLCISWGYAPVMSSACDAEIMPNGALRLCAGRHE